MYIYTYICTHTHVLYVGVYICTCKYIYLSINLSPVGEIGANILLAEKVGRMYLARQDDIHHN